MSSGDLRLRAPARSAARAGRRGRVLPIERGGHAVAVGWIGERFLGIADFDAWTSGERASKVRKDGVFADWMAEDQVLSRERDRLATAEPRGSEFLVRTRVA